MINKKLDQEIKNSKVFNNRFYLYARWIYEFFSLNNIITDYYEWQRIVFFEIGKLKKEIKNIRVNRISKKNSKENLINI